MFANLNVGQLEIECQHTHATIEAEFVERYLVAKRTHQPRHGEQ